MIRRPRRSTLFPSPTLFRSGVIEVVPPLMWPTTSGAASRTTSARSEEHTSELQSQSNLVCRLLLEKKKRRQHDRQVRADQLFDAHSATHCTMAAMSSAHSDW